MDLLTVGQIYFELKTYPEHRHEERFLQGLWGVEVTYVYQVYLTQGGVKIHWGVRKRGWWGEPQITKYHKVLLGALITGYPMSAASFQVVKRLPTWPLLPDQTLALQLGESPARFGAHIQMQVHITRSLPSFPGWKRKEIPR